MEHSSSVVQGQPGTAGKFHRAGLSEAPSGLKPEQNDRHAELLRNFSYLKCAFHRGFAD